MTRRKFSVRKLTVAALLGSFSIFLIAGLHSGYQQLIGNFHTVVAGEVYRSAQPNADDLRQAKNVHGIRAILNLRDEERTEWYSEEKAEADKLGIQLIDFPISSSKGLTVAEAETLANLMRGLPKPFLIHCEHGSNRTGLASAIYLDAVAQTSDLYATLQLTPYYGHYPIPGIGRYEIFKSFRTFQAQSSM